MLTGAVVFLLPRSGEQTEWESVAPAGPMIEQPVQVIRNIAMRATEEPVAVLAVAVVPLVEQNLVQGSVTDTRGVPVPGAVVRVTARVNMLDGQGQSLYPLEPASFTNSDALGRFSFRHAGAVLYDLVISAAGFAPETLTSQQGSHCTAVLTLPATVSGTVTDGNGNAIEGAELNLVQGSRRIVGSTSRSGSYRFEQVAGGAALLEVAHPQFEPQLLRIPAILEDEEVVLDVSLQIGSALTGRVLRANGQAASNATVVVQDLMRMLPCGTLLTDLNGMFRMQSVMLGGRYRISAHGEDCAASLTIHVPREGPAPLVELHLAPRWVFEGTVTAQGGTAIQDATIMLVAENGTNSATTITGSNGGFVVKELVVGMSYRLIAVSPGFAVFQAAGLTALNPQIAAVLEEALSADGHVVSIHGLPLQGAAVKLTFPNNAAAPIFTLTGPDGRWHFDGLPSGDAWMTVMRAGYENSVSSITLVAPARLAAMQTQLSPLN